MTKFNRSSGTGSFFPIKQYRFNTDRHPIIKDESKCTAPLSTLISHDEQRMLEGLQNTLQCALREAVRVSLYEASRAVVTDLLEARLYSRPDTKERGHTVRKTKLSIRVPKEERAAALALAKALGVSEKEVIRVAFIWLAQGIRDDRIKRLTNCSLIPQAKLAREWSKTYDPSVGSKLKPLKSAGKEAYDQAAALGQEVDDLLYERRGRMMDQLKWEADGGFNPAVDPFTGEYNLEVVDAHLAMEAEEEERAFMDSIAEMPRAQQIEMLTVRNELQYPDMDEELARELAEAILDGEQEREEELTELCELEEFQTWQPEVKADRPPIEIRGLHRLKDHEPFDFDDEEKWEARKNQIIAEVMAEQEKNNRDRSA